MSSASPKGVRDFRASLGYPSGVQASGKFQSALEDHWRQFLSQGGEDPNVVRLGIQRNPTGETQINGLVQTFVEKHAQTFWPEKDSPCDSRIIWPEHEETIRKYLEKIFWYKRDKTDKPNKTQKSVEPAAEGAAAQGAEDGSPPKTSRQQAKDPYSVPDDSERGATRSTRSVTEKRRRDDEDVDTARTPKKARVPIRKGRWPHMYQVASARRLRRDPGGMPSEDMPPTAAEPREGMDAACHTVITISDHDTASRSPSTTLAPEPRTPFTTLPADIPIRRSRSLEDSECLRDPLGLAAPVAHMTPTIEWNSPLLPSVEPADPEEPAALPLMSRDRAIRQHRVHTRSAIAPTTVAHVPTIAASIPPSEIPQVRVMYRVRFTEGTWRHTRVWIPPRELDDMSFDEMLREIPLKLNGPSPMLCFTLTDDVAHTWEQPVHDQETFELMKRYLQMRRDEYASYVLGSQSKWFFVYIEEI